MRETCGLTASRNVATPARALTCTTQHVDVGGPTIKSVGVKGPIEEVGAGGHAAATSVHVRVHRRMRGGGGCASTSPNAPVGPRQHQQHAPLAVRFLAHHVVMRSYQRQRAVAQSDSQWARQLRPICDDCVWREARPRSRAINGYAVQRSCPHAHRLRSTASSWKMRSRSKCRRAPRSASRTGVCKKAARDTELLLLPLPPPAIIAA